MAALVKRWKHTMCGKISEFPPGTNPNSSNQVCGNCGVALGNWVPA